MRSEFRLAADTIDREDLDELIAWLGENPRLTQGGLVRRFEREWAEWIGTRHALFVNSGSSANLLMYYALFVSRILRNKKVVVPAVAWSTTIAPAIQLGFEPIMCEVEAATFGMDPNHLEDLLKRHEPGAVAVVHVLGTPCDLSAVCELREHHDFVLMEDACAAIGSTYDGRRVGTFGRLSTFSFYFGHQISTIEGGMVCTDDDELHKVLLQLRSHGWERDLSLEDREARARSHGISGFNQPFTFYYPGFNLRSSELNARIGLSQMKKIDAVVQRRVENHELYQSLLAGEAGFHCQRNERASICSIAFVALAQSSEHRDEIAETLREHRIETRPLGGGNFSRQPFWTADRPVHEFAVADRIGATAFQLPNHPAYESEDVRFICERVLEPGRSGRGRGAAGSGAR